MGVGESGSKFTKAQNTIEYLADYGWAILIIAIVVAVLFGLFSGFGKGPNDCIPLQGFMCASPVLTSNQLSFTLSQTSGQYYYGDWVFVTAEGAPLSANGIPYNLSTANMVSLGSLNPGQTINVAFNSFAAGGIPSNLPVGTPFDGYIWLGYCSGSPCGSSGPTNYAKVGTISTTATSSTMVTPNYLLTDYASPVSGGTVTPGTGFYARGAKVILVASNSSGYKFTGWSCSGAGCYSGPSNSVALTIDNNITEIADFELIVSQFSFNVVITPSLSGTVYPSNGLQDVGSNVLISAYANSNYTFSNWVGTGVGSYTGSNNPATVTMSGDIFETASFAQSGGHTFLLNMSVNPSGGGTVSPGNALESANQIYTILASPTTGYEFHDWIGNGIGNYTGTSNPASIRMNSNMTEVANFSLQYIPITLTNAQSTPTSANFQQMLVIDSHNYADFIRPKWTNIEFTTGPHSGTVLQAWVESGATNASTRTVVWINMGSDTIAANSNTVIYMDFMPGNVMSASGPTGEAPELTCTSGPPTSNGCTPYATYDNGASVFTNYQNFAGSGAAPSGWYSSGQSTGCSYVSYNNGYDIGAVNGCGWVYFGSDFPINSGLVMDTQLTYIQTNTAGNWQDPFIDSASSSGWSPQGAAVGWQDNYACNGNDEGAPFVLTSGPGGTVIGSDSGVYPPGVITVTNSEVYSNYTSAISGTDILSDSGYVVLASYTTNYCGSSFSGYWVRTREAPPGGVMPSVTFGT